MATHNDSYAALRFSSYRFFTTSNMAAVIGAQMLNLALGYELYQRTGEPMSLAWLALAAGAPTLLFSLFAGQVADWLDRRRILMTTQVLSLLCSCALAALSYSQGDVPKLKPLAGATTITGQYELLPVLLMYLCAFARGTCGAFGRPARQALLPQILPKAVFPNAVAWNSTVFQLSSVIGPGLGGLILAYTSAPLAYLADAACLLLALTLLFFLKRPEKVTGLEPTRVANLMEGLQFVFRTKALLASLTLDMFAVLLGGATALLPLFAKILQVDETGLGYLRAAPAAGAICMALFLAHSRPLKKAGPVLLWAVAGYGLAMMGFGLSKSFPLSLLLLFISGLCDNISVVVRHTLVQLLSPDSLRGRVSAVNVMFIGASNEMGDFRASFSAKLFGPVVAVAAGGLGTIGVVIGVTLLWPQLRRIGALQDVKPEGQPLPAGSVAVEAVRQV